MNLTRWLTQAKISQRDLAKRLGYKGNGFITLVNKGERAVPAEDIPAWADALRLEDEDRRDFIDECAEESIPKWYRDRVSAAESEVAILRTKEAKLRTESTKIRAELAKLAAQIAQRGAQRD